MTTSTSAFNAINSGKFVTVTFKTYLGNIRTINGRTGVKVHLKNKKQPLLSTIKPDSYIVIYDLNKKGYRSIKRDSIIKINAEGYSVGENQSSVYARKIKA
jgi:hypothetical protein